MAEGVKIEKVSDSEAAAIAATWNAEAGDKKRGRWRKRFHEKLPMKSDYTADA
jgi:hypothetical protein